MCCIEDRSCDIVRTFWCPPVIQHTGQWGNSTHVESTFFTTRKYSMSMEIHQIWLKKKSTKLVNFRWPCTFQLIDRLAAIMASLFISFQIGSYKLEGHHTGAYKVVVIPGANAWLEVPLPNQSIEECEKYRLETLKTTAVLTKIRFKQLHSCSVSAALQCEKASSDSILISEISLFRSPPV